MIKEKLTDKEIITGGGATLKILLTHEDFTEETAAKAQTLELFTARAGSLVQLVGMSVLTAPADADDSAYNSTGITIGISTDTDAILTTTETNANATSPKSAVAGGLATAYAADTGIVAEVSAMTGKSLSSLDSGKILLLFKVVEMPKFRG